LPFSSPEFLQSLSAMGYPGSSFEKAWRNSKDDVAAFFQGYHDGHYLIINVSERPYDTNFFQKAVYLGWPDHHPPSLALLFKCIQTMDAWLNADPLNVVAIHCMAGRGRTGTVISSFFLYTRMFATASEALSFFASKRSMTAEGVGVPSQIRYVEYIQIMMNNNFTIPMEVVPEAKRLALNCIVMRPVPGVDLSGDFTPSVVIECFSAEMPVILFSNQSDELRTYTTLEPAVPVDTKGLIVQGDILVRVYSEGSLPPFTDKPIFRFGFHTSFLPGYIFDLTKNQLDGGAAGPLRDERVPPDFAVRLMFAETVVVVL